MFSKAKKYFISAAVLLLSALPLTAAVQVSEGKILLGNSFQLASGSPAEFECRITNPDPKGHKVMIRLSPGSYGSGLNSSSPEFTIPPRTTLIRRFPVFTGSEEKFTFSVFVDGVRQPNSTLNECSVKFVPFRTGTVGILNDNGNAPGGFKQNRYLCRQYTPVTFRAGSLPKNREFYRSLCALIIVVPDFSKYTSEQYAAVLEYAANGGLVIFSDPEGTLAAAETPLADLLGVVPLGIRMVPAGRFLKKGKNHAEINPHEIKFLVAAEKSGRQTDLTRSDSGFPVYQESRYGLGTVRFLAFAPINENFPHNGDTADFYTAKLLNIPDAGQSQLSFRAPLDRLTGFTVPQTQTVRNILVIYFAVLLVILVLGFRWNRHIGAWLATALTAFLFTAGLLFHVRKTLGKRGAIAAVLQVDNAQTPGAGCSYISLYAPAEMKTTVKSSSPRNLFELLPFRRYLAYASGGLGDFNASPLDLRMQDNDTMLIREINLAARSSRQVMEHQSASALPGNGAVWQTPRLILSADGMKLEPWKLPDARAVEAVFVLFPNGSKAADISPDGICTMKTHDSAIADPLIQDIRIAMEKSYAKKHPALVVVSGKVRRHPGLDSAFLQQGKTVTVYPAELKTMPGGVLIPSELLVLTPAEAGSRMVLEGGRPNMNYSIQAGMSVSLNACRSDAVNFPAEFSSFRVKATISGSGRVEPVVKISFGSGRAARVITGRKIRTGEYLFGGEEFKKLASGPLPVTVQIEGVLRKDKKNEADFSVENWSLLDLQLELRGRKMSVNKENIK